MIMVDNTKNADLRELKPRIVVMGVGGAGGNALNNMVAGGLEGVEFVAANTDAQALLTSRAEKVIQIGVQLTEGLGAGSRAEIGAAAAEEAADEIRSQLDGAHMVFVTAGMGGGTGSGAAPVISRIARELGILTVGVVTKPFQFEGLTRMNTAEKAIKRLRESVDTLIVIPNQNLFRITNEQTTFSDAFAMADKVLHSGIACITDLMVKEGLINLDFADVKIVMSNMGKSMMGSGIASGENRGREAAEIAISNPLLDDVTLEGAKGVLISIIGGKDLTLFEVEQAAETIRKVVDTEANIIVGATFDEERKGDVLVSVLATGLGGVTGIALPVNQGKTVPKAASPIAEPAPVTPAPKQEAVEAVSPAVFRPVEQEEIKTVGNDSLEMDIENESVSVSEDKGVEDWVSDEGVTIQPMKQRKNAQKIGLNVAEKAHENDDIMAKTRTSFVPMPVSAAPAMSSEMPTIDDFSPIAQKALQAQKEPDDNSNASLFARLSGLGKRLSKPEDERLEQTGDNRKVEPVLPMVNDEPEALVDNDSNGEEQDVFAMGLTTEERMEIPSFFKRKNAG